VKDADCIKAIASPSAFLCRHYGGYDTYLLGNFFGLTTFARKYGPFAGVVDGVNTYQVSQRGNPDVDTRTVCPLKSSLLEPSSS